MQGASKIIERDMPVMTICAYHKAEDLANIPQFINQFSNAKVKYNFYLRHHMLFAKDLILYAVPN